MIRGERMHDPALEWLEADGLGGFAMGTAAGLRSRRYHGLLCAAQRPPSDRRMLVPAVEAWIDLGHGPRALSAHHYLPGVIHPDGASRLESFTTEPWPTWVYVLEDGVRVQHEVVVPRGSPRVVLLWRLVGAASQAKLILRPLLAARDVHSLRREGDGLEGGSVIEGGLVRWRPDPASPGITARASGAFHAGPVWYRDFLYAEERARGYDHVEDLLSPGTFEDRFQDGAACLILAAEVAGTTAESLPVDRPALRVAHELRERERERRSASTPLARAAEAYLVRRGSGLSIIAGYPWFGDWGRDTFQSLRGLLLARGRADEAATILAAWAEHVSAGLLPNRFPDDAGAPEYNSVDAALWFVVAVQETLAAVRGFAGARRHRLERAACSVLEAFAAGTSWGIRADSDGLLACGAPGSQLTWMDARVHGQPITPRCGKPVEVQALWIHALTFGARFDGRFRALGENALRAFEGRFWNEDAGHLNDVVDVDHLPGTFDATLRPNQALALGGLERVLVAPERARRAVDALERELWTPLGLRSLAPGDARYRGRYHGSPEERDGVYHQGTVWPWLIGPFVEAWVRVRGSSVKAREEARARFLPAFHAHLGEYGLGHVSELADGDAPHRSGGCPFQAWSLGELLRLEQVLRAPAGARRERRRAASGTE